MAEEAHHSGKVAGIGVKRPMAEGCADKAQLLSGPP